LRIEWRERVSSDAKKNWMGKKGDRQEKKRGSACKK